MHAQSFLTALLALDRDVSDQALDAADAAYRSLFPSRGSLQMMLLARHSWKKTLAGATPVYVRPAR